MIKIIMNIGILVCVVCFAVLYLSDSAESQSPIFTAGGKPFNKVANVSKTPKIIADTVRMSGGYGSLTISNSFSRASHDVSPTSAKTMMVAMTPEMVDTTDTPPTYGWQLNLRKDRLIIRSSNANDSLRVGVIIIVK